MIYLDSNATTALDPRALEAMLPYLRELWVNPSSGYGEARRVRHALESAREQVAGLIGAAASEVHFTSCGTESINAVHASVRELWPASPRLLTTATEHAAGIEAAARWQQAGGEVARIPVDAGGRVAMAALEEELSKGGVALVSIMWANNETGVVAPMSEIVAMAHAAGAQVHSDAVQAVGKVPIHLQEVPVDYLSLSGHKMHGPKGVGALFVSQRMRFRPLLVGGGQESGRRSGTENMAGIVGLGVAAEGMKAALADGSEAAVGGLRDRLETAVLEQVPGARVNGDLRHRLPTTSSLTFPGLIGAEMLILLDKQGVACSAGSACHTASMHPSHVLEAMGVSAELAASTLRFSLSRFSTEAEVDAAIERIVAIAGRLRDLADQDGGPVVMG